MQKLWVTYILLALANGVFVANDYFSLIVGSGWAVLFGLAEVSLASAAFKIMLISLNKKRDGLIIFVIFMMSNYVLTGTVLAILDWSIRHRCFLCKG